MMAGGDDGTDKAARTLARRPTIRPRAVTPPRTTLARTTTPAPTWKLPPVRLPSPRVSATEAARAAARPVLLLVADASDHFEVARLHDDRASGALRPAWRAPRTTALAAATMMVLLAAAVVVGVSASGRPTAQVRASASSSALSSALPARIATAAARAEQPAAPQIPVFDVKSLPPAPRRK